MHLSAAAYSHVQTFISLHDGVRGRDKPTRLPSFTKVLKIIIIIATQAGEIYTHDGSFHLDRSEETRVLSEVQSPNTGDNYLRKGDDGEPATDRVRLTQTLVQELSPYDIQPQVASLGNNTDHHVAAKAASLES
jgi:hypothetical protein